jgi:hypothetical protein
MAENYTLFSAVIVGLTDVEATWLRARFESIYVLDGEEHDGSPPTDVLKRCTFIGDRAFRHAPDDLSPSCQFAYEFRNAVRGYGRYLWIYSEDEGDLEQVGYLVHTFLARWRPRECWVMSFAITCSKPRLGGIGGGYVYADRDGFEIHESNEESQARCDQFHAQQG